MQRPPASSANGQWPLRKPGGILALARKFWAVMTITIATRFAYLGELLVRSIFLVLILFIFTQLWQATAQTRDILSITGFTIAQLIWYLAFTESIATSVTTPEIDVEVRSGDIAYRLARPLPYPVYHLGAMLGERVLRFTMNLAVGCFVAWIVVGPIQITPFALAAALSTAVVSFVADRMIVLTIGLISFWVEDVSGLYLLYSRAVMILGGMLLPIEVYPTWLQRVAAALPFQYLMYYPARLFVGADLRTWLHVLGAQLLIVGMILLLLMLIYHLGLRRVSAQGG